MLFFGLVAIGALGIEVQSDQLEIGHRVIETIFVETDDVGIAAEMIGVTGVAL